MQVDREQKIRDNKIKTLSRILGINPNAESSKHRDIDLITKLKEKLNTDSPLLKLSIEDYIKMCKNKMLFNMMLIPLNTDKKRLTKICKNIDILIENINESPQTIKNKIEARTMSILDLPDDIKKTFVSITMKRYILQDWIPSHYITMGCLSANHNAMDFLSLPNNQKLINYYMLSKNTNLIAIRFLKEKVLEEFNLKPLKSKLNWNELLKNSVAIDYLKEEFEKYFIEDPKKDLMYLLSNTNSKAIQILKKLLENGKYTKEDIYWDTLSENPSTEAYAFLQENIGNLIYENFSRNINPEAIKLLEKEADRELTLNLDDYTDLDDNKKINWHFLSTNPKAVHILKKRWKEEKLLMKKYIDKYNRLKELNMVVSWKYLPKNPNPEVMDLIKEKLIEEHKLSVDDYNGLNDVEKIDWSNLSSNPNAIDILTENKNRIDYRELSKNPKAIKLIKNKIMEEISLDAEDISDICYLSENPSIFILE